MPRTPRRPRPLLPALTAVVAGALAAALMVPAGTASAEPDPTTPAADALDALDVPEVPDVTEATEALEVAEELLTGDGAGDTGSRGTTAPTEAPSATLALRDLAFAARALEGRDRARADGLLARPTDGAGDQFGDGYAGNADRQRSCATDVCVHWVTNTEDRTGATFSPARALEVAQDVHTHHVDELGWRAPRTDGSRGGDAKFDVYLANIGDQGLYGYCAPDNRVAQRGKTAVAYCVLDNDYAEAAFAKHTPDENLRVTMAHEYLHAIQYNYDATEDGWLFEATATWMEEQYADEVNDNRQYLAAGQLRRPRAVLDAFNFGAQSVYANWIFFEHLANRYGRGVVRAVWERAGAYAGAPDLASVPAVARTLSARKSTLRAAYARFAADNTVPGRTPYYPEGDEWGLKASPVKTVGLTRSRRASSQVEVYLDHLTSGTVAVRSSDLARGTRLRVAVDGPSGASGPAVFALVHRKDGTLGRRFVPLNGPSGAKTVSFPFASGDVSKVTLTLVNASQRYRCNRGTDLSCAGTSLDDRRRFTLKATAVG